MLARTTFGAFYDPQEDYFVSDCVELDGKIETCKPDFWLNIDPQIRPIPGVEPLSESSFKSAKKSIAAELKSFESKLKRFPPEYMHMIVKGVPVIDVTVLSHATITKIATSAPTIGDFAMLGRSIRAIDRIRVDLREPGLSEVLKLRQLCIQVLRLLCFENY